ncbi:hypothetical protein PORCAN_1996 [Porphyromonas crevioricanis JCM 13913]|nr:hypothetical protein PORCAN_1996 [Porphyromonas crevioricanis JCM 13913]
MDLFFVSLGIFLSIARYSFREAPNESVKSNKAFVRKQ